VEDFYDSLSHRPQARPRGHPGDLRTPGGPGGPRRPARHLA